MTTLIPRVKCIWNLPEPLVERIRKEAARRSQITGNPYGQQTAVVKLALEKGLAALERQKVKA